MVEARRLLPDDVYDHYVRPVVFSQLREKGSIGNISKGEARQCEAETVNLTSVPMTHRAGETNVTQLVTKALSQSNHLGYKRTEITQDYRVVPLQSIHRCKDLPSNFSTTAGHRLYHYIHVCSVVEMTVRQQYGIQLRRVKTVPAGGGSHQTTGTRVDEELNTCQLQPDTA